MATTIQDLPGEIWKPVVGYEGAYKVSTFGRVRSLDREVACSRKISPTGRKLFRGRVLRALSVGAYLAVSLSVRGRSRSIYVHRIVLEAFAGACPPGMEACHNDGDPTNNRPTNLRWDSRAHNHLDKRTHGTSAAGTKNPAAKLTEAMIPEIRRRQAAGESDHSIARDYGVWQSTIRDIRIGRSWTHVTAQE